MTLLRSPYKSIRVGVLRGGPSHEYDVSLKTGAYVLEHMPHPFEAQDILISRDGAWHAGGFTKTPEKALSQIDVVFNALHGGYGEDGKVQAILRTLGKYHTGSETLPSSMSMNKGITKNIFGKAGIKTPFSLILKPKDNTRRRVIEVFQSFPQPSIVKPLSGGSSLSTSIARDFATFEKAVESAFRHSGAVLIEEYISGLEATCGVLDSSDRTSAEALIPIAIFTSPDIPLFNYESKYGAGEMIDITTRYFSAFELAEIQRLAILAHLELGLRHYSRSDFIVTKNRGIYALETNSLPALTPHALYTKSLEASKVSFPEFLHRVISGALVS